MYPVVLPERPQDQARFILLDRERAHSLGVDPGKPRASRKAIGRVLVQEESFLHQRLLAELEELARDVLVACPVESIGYERAVSRPRVRVCVTGELRDVEVGGRDDRAVVVRVGARGEDAAPVQLRDVGAELLIDVPMVLLRPDAPVGECPAVIRVRPATDDQVLAVSGDLAEPRTHANPMSEGAGLHGFGDVSYTTLTL